MRLATVRRPDGTTRAAHVDGDKLVLLDAADVGAVHRLRRRLAPPGRGRRRRAIALADATLATLIPRPPKVWCVGLNYANHIAETGRETPEYPTLFAKFAIALTGPHDPIARRPPPATRSTGRSSSASSSARPRPRRDRGRRPRPRGRLHGRQRRVDARLAAPHRAVPAGQDVGARPRPWARGWSRPTRCRAGGKGLRVRTTVDDQVMQDDTTDQLLFDVPTSCPT